MGSQGGSYIKKQKQKTNQKKKIPVPQASRGSRLILARFLREGRWGPMAHGPWPMAQGPWPTAHGPWPMDSPKNTLYFQYFAMNEHPIAAVKLSLRQSTSPGHFLSI